MVALSLQLLLYVSLKPLLDRFGNERALTIILFTLDETVYARELAPLAEKMAPVLPLDEMVGAAPDFRSALAVAAKAAKPAIEVLYDPSQQAVLAMVKGMLTQQVMQVVSAEMFGGKAGQAFTDKSMKELEQGASTDPDVDCVRVGMRLYSSSGTGWVPGTPRSFMWRR